MRANFSRRATLQTRRRWSRFLIGRPADVEHAVLQMYRQILLEAIFPSKLRLESTSSIE